MKLKFFNKGNKKNKDRSKDRLDGTFAPSSPGVVKGKNVILSQNNNNNPNNLIRSSVDDDLSSQGSNNTSHSKNTSNFTSNPHSTNQYTSQQSLISQARSKFENFDGPLNPLNCKSTCRPNSSGSSSRLNNNHSSDGYQIPKAENAYQSRGKGLPVQTMNHTKNVSQNVNKPDKIIPVQSSMKSQITTDRQNNNERIDNYSKIGLIKQSLDQDLATEELNGVERDNLTSDNETTKGIQEDNNNNSNANQHSDHYSQARPTSKPLPIRETSSKVYDNSTSNNLNDSDLELEETTQKADELLASIDAICDEKMMDSEQNHLQNNNNQVHNLQDNNHNNNHELHVGHLDNNFQLPLHNNQDLSSLPNVSFNDNPQNLNFANNGDSNLQNCYDSVEANDPNNLHQINHNHNQFHNQNHLSPEQINDAYNQIPLAHQQAPITLPQIVNHLDAIHFPPQQLQHLNEIKETWQSLNCEVDTFAQKFNPTLEQLIDQHENLVRKTNDILDRMPATAGSSPVKNANDDNESIKSGSAGDTSSLSEGKRPGPAVRSARFRGNAAGSASSNSPTASNTGPSTGTMSLRSNPAHRRLTVEWEQFSKTVNKEFLEIREALQYYLNTQYYLSQQLNELGDTIDETDSVQLKLLQFKSDYQKLARDYRTLQFKLQHSKSQLIINATYDRYPDASVILQQEMKEIESNNQLLEQRNNELIEENSNLKINKLIRERLNDSGNCSGTETINSSKNDCPNDTSNNSNNDSQNDNTLIASNNSTALNAINLDEVTKLEIQLLRESIAAISKENEKLQVLYSKSLKNLYFPAKRNSVIDNSQYHDDGQNLHDDHRFADDDNDHDNDMHCHRDLTVNNSMMLNGGITLGERQHSINDDETCHTIEDLKTERDNFANNSSQKTNSCKPRDIRRNVSEVNSYLEDEINVMQEQIKETEIENESLKQNNEKLSNDLSQMEVQNVRLLEKLEEYKRILSKNSNKNRNDSNNNNTCENDSGTVASDLDLNSNLSDEVTQNTQISNRPNNKEQALAAAKNAEIEAKLKKLKAQNDRYKKDRKRANQLATMLPEISFKEELDQLKKLTKNKIIPEELFIIMSDKYEAIKEQNTVLANELKKGGKYTKNIGSSTTGSSSEQGVKVKNQAESPVNLKHHKGSEGSKGTSREENEGSLRDGFEVKKESIQRRNQIPV